MLCIWNDNNEMVTKERKLNIVASMFLLGFIGLILFGWYEMLSTPKTKLSIFIAGLIILLWNILFTISDFLPANVMKTPNFITRAGGIGAFQGIEHYEGGMSKAFVSVRRAYAYDNGLKPKPRHLIDSIASGITPNVVVEVAGETWKFEDIPRGVCDAREGAIFFHGSLNFDKHIPSEYEVYQAKINKYEVLIRELITICESSKSVTGKLSEEEAKSVMETSLKASVVVGNLAKVLQPRQPQQDMRQF